MQPAFLLHSFGPLSVDENLILTSSTDLILVAENAQVIDIC